MSILSRQGWFTNLLVWMAGVTLKRMLKRVIDAKHMQEIKQVAASSRNQYDRMRWLCWKNKKVAELSPIEVMGQRVYRYQPKKQSSPGQVDKVLILLHGGAFIIGGNGSHGALASELAYALSSTVYLVQYPLFPEATLASIVAKCVQLVPAIIKQTRCKEYSIFGDSAGGFLACHVVSELIQRGYKKPKVLYLLSPLLQNQFDFDSAACLAQSRSDYLLGPSYRYLIHNPAKRAVALERLGAKVVPPVLSIADELLAQFPPLHITYSENEVLVPEISALQKRLATLNVPSVDNSVENAFHAFAVYTYVAVSKRYFAQISQFDAQYSRL